MSFKEILRQNLMSNMDEQEARNLLGVEAKVGVTALYCWRPDEAATDQAELFALTDHSIMRAVLTVPFADQPEIQLTQVTVRRYPLKAAIEVIRTYELTPNPDEMSMLLRVRFAEGSGFDDLHVPKPTTPHQQEQYRRLVGLLIHHVG